jgi:hypothetical protein
MGIKWGRVMLLVCIALFGYVKQGFSGMLWSLLAFCFACFVYYAIVDGLAMLGTFFRRPTNVFINVDGSSDGKSTPGHPDVEGKAWRENPDPTRPDAEDFAGLLTYRIGRGRHGE